MEIRKLFNRQHWKSIIALNTEVMFMKIYTYDRNTKEFLREETAFCDPKETQLKGFDVYLIPPYSVTVEPPEKKDGFARVWNCVDAWTYMEDHRGESVWKSYTEQMIVTELGAIPEGWSKVRPEKPLSVLDYDMAMEEHIRKARFERGYTTREPSEYRSSSVARWAQDAEDYIKFRDECMMYGLTVQNDYAAGKEAPTVEEFKKNLPVCVWTYGGE
jgi:hypothetical protein